MQAGLGTKRWSHTTSASPASPLPRPQSAYQPMISRNAACGNAERSAVRDVHACIGYTEFSHLKSFCLCDFGIGIRITSELLAVPTAREPRPVWKARRKKRV